MDSVSGGSAPDVVGVILVLITLLVVLTPPSMIALLSKTYWYWWRGNPKHEADILVGPLQPKLRSMKRDTYWTPEEFEILKKQQAIL